MHLAMASFLSGERAFGHPGDIFESSLWMMWFVELQPKCIPVIDTFALASGSAATSCRLCGCKYLVCACRTSAAAPTLAAAAYTSVAACCCYRWPPFLRWACVLLAGLPRSKLLNTLLQQSAALSRVEQHSRFFVHVCVGRPCSRRCTHDVPCTIHCSVAHFLQAHAVFCSSSAAAFLCGHRTRARGFHTLFVRMHRCVYVWPSHFVPRLPRDTVLLSSCIPRIQSCHRLACACVCRFARVVTESSAAAGAARS